MNKNNAILATLCILPMLFASGCDSAVASVRGVDVARGLTDCGFVLEQDAGFDIWTVNVGYRRNAYPADDVLIAGYLEKYGDCLNRKFSLNMDFHVPGTFENSKVFDKDLQSAGWDQRSEHIFSPDAEKRIAGNYLVVVSTHYPVILAVVGEN